MQWSRVRKDGLILDSTFHFRKYCLPSYFLFYKFFHSSNVTEKLVVIGENESNLRREKNRKISLGTLANHSP